MQTQSEKPDLKLISDAMPPRDICGYSFDEYLEQVLSFHGYTAPGVVLGGVMVDAAIKRLPANILFDAVCETSYCLPDAIQMLTPCTTGNGWLRVVNLGRYALSFYDKYKGQGIRVAVDSEGLEKWGEIKTWLFKLKEKKDQDTPLLMNQIRQAGEAVLRFETVHIKPKLLEKRHKGRVINCPFCGEAYPRKHGNICRACQGQAPYVANGTPDRQHAPRLLKVPLSEAVGRRALHDMTEIIPGKKKAPAFRRGQPLDIGDICRLQQMGRQNIYTLEENKGVSDQDWVHEDEAALSFAKYMAGDGVIFKEPPREGKISFITAREGLLTVDEHRLEMFNMQPGVMCATRKNYTFVSKGRSFAGTRAIPLYLSQSDFSRASAVLSDGPLFHIRAMRKLRVGILVTGTEVFSGIIQDKFIPIIRAKAEKYGCTVTRTAIVPDDAEAICKGVTELLHANVSLLITTAGLSVDPDDVTRQGLVQAGATDMLYGAPILPGAMTLLANIRKVKVFGVPACALYFRTTSFDLLLPRLLANIPITRNDLAKLGHGAFCQECKTCQYPKCAFGK